MSFEETIQLETIAHGALNELFQEEVKRVVQNIQDPNTDANVVREITLKIKLKPDDTREVAVVDIAVTSKLAGNKGVGTIFYVGMVDGKPVAVEHNPRQTKFDFEQKSKAIETALQTAVEGGKK